MSLPFQLGFRGPMIPAIFNHQGLFSSLAFSALGINSRISLFLILGEYYAKQKSLSWTAKSCM